MENLKEGFNYFYKNGDDIKYVNDTINTQHDTDGTGDTGAPIQTGQFYNYVMDNFGKNPTDYNGINYAGILVEPGGVDGFTHIPPLASFYTSRGLDNTQDHRGWTDVLNSDIISDRRMTCGSVIDFLHSLKHLTSSTGDINIDIQTKYDDISDDLCKEKKIPIGNNFLNLNNELIQYLQQTCNICNSDDQWKQN